MQVFLFFFLFSHQKQNKKFSSNTTRQHLSLKERQTYQRHSLAGKRIPVSYRWMTEQRVWACHWISHMSPVCLITRQLTRHGVVELILAEGTPRWRSLDDGLLKFVVLRGESLQRFREDLILLYLLLQFQTAHLSSPHTNTHTHAHTRRQKETD